MISRFLYKIVVRFRAKIETTTKRSVVAGKKYILLTATYADRCKILFKVKF